MSDAATTFDVEVIASDRNATIRVAGDLDLTAITEFVHAGHNAVDGSSSEIHLDLGDLTFCSAGALSEIVRLQARCERAGRSFVIDAATPAFVRLARITGMTTVLPLDRQPA